MSETVIPLKTYDVLNLIKIIAAFFVVTIHVHFPGDFGLAVIDIARFAVPFFFMVSGFFGYCLDKNRSVEKIKKRIKNIIFMFLSISVVYIVYKIVVAVLFYSNSPADVLEELFSAEAIVNFIFFNEPSVSVFLWYLPALIYTYVVFLVFEKNRLTQKMYFLIPFLFIAGVAFREIIEIPSDLPAFFRNSFLFRNYLFVGVPFFLFGHYIKSNEDKIKKEFSYLSLIFIMLAGFAESVIAGNMHLQKNVYLGTFTAVFAIFVLAIKAEDRLNVKKISVAGSKYSMYIYLLHILVKNIIIICVQYGGLNKLYNELKFIMPVIVFVITFIVSVVFVFIKDKIKNLIKVR